MEINGKNGNNLLMKHLYSYPAVWMSMEGIRRFNSRICIISI